MERAERTDRFAGVENRFAGYEVYDNRGEKIGKVDDLFLNEADQPEYIGVKMGFLGTKSTLIPREMVRVDEATKRMTVSADKETLKGGPAFDDHQEITPESEMRVHNYYGLRRATAGTGERGAYGAHYSSVEEERAVATTGEDELRVQRSEEELRAGTREREAGAVRVRKRVRTDRERFVVPKRREEVTVDRVPVEGEASEAQIGEEEIRVPLTEEEVVVEKRPVAKEEIRIRKDVVEDTEVVEEDVRREEVEIDDESTGRTR
jgi:uncharacterized protein (TIGR02271 family)